MGLKGKIFRPVLLCPFPVLAEDPLRCPCFVGSLSRSDGAGNLKSLTTLRPQELVERLSDRYAGMFFFFFVRVTARAARKTSGCEGFSLRFPGFLRDCHAGCLCFAPAGQTHEGFPSQFQRTCRPGDRVGGGGCVFPAALIMTEGIRLSSGEGNSDWLLSDSPAFKPRGRS